MNRWERVLRWRGPGRADHRRGGIGKSRLVQRFHEQIAGTTVYLGRGGRRRAFPEHALLSGHRDVAAKRSLAMPASTTRSERAVGERPAGRTQSGRSGAADRAAAEPSRCRRISALDDAARTSSAAACSRHWSSGCSAPPEAQPLVIATEDLHWADPSTLELIQLLVEQGATPVCCCCTRRGLSSMRRGHASASYANHAQPAERA